MRCEKCMCSYLIQFSTYTIFRVVCILYIRTYVDVVVALFISVDSVHARICVCMLLNGSLILYTICQARTGNWYIHTYVPSIVLHSTVNI